MPTGSGTSVVVRVVLARAGAALDVAEGGMAAAGAALVVAMLVLPAMLEVCARPVSEAQRSNAAIDVIIFLVIGCSCGSFGFISCTGLIKGPFLLSPPCEFARPARLLRRTPCRRRFFRSWRP